MRRTRFIALAGSAASIVATSRALAGSNASVMDVHNNRAYLHAVIEGPSGKSLPLRCWLDSGGGSLVLPEATARKLDFPVPSGQPDGTYVAIKVPMISVAGSSVRPFPGTLAYIQTGASSNDLMGGSDAFLPLSLFRYYACKFDYANRNFELNPPTISGTRIPVSISSRGFPLVNATVGGRSYAFLVDTGAACTMLSRGIVDDLNVTHPEWPRVEGCFGPANMVGGVFDSQNIMLRVQSLTIGGVVQNDVVLVSRREGIFETNMSKLMSGPIVGAIGGNVLSRCELVVDFPNSAVYLDPIPRQPDDDFTMVPLTLTAQVRGPRIDRAGVDAAAIIDIAAGDILLAIDGRPTTIVPLQNVFEMLRGTIGSLKDLTVQRNGATLHANARVVSIV